MGNHVQFSFYDMTFLMDPEETFPKSMSENILVVSPIVRAKSIGSHDWNCLRILAKRPILLHCRLSTLHAHGSASLLHAVAFLNVLLAQNQTRVLL